MRTGARSDSRPRPGRLSPQEWPRDRRFLRLSEPTSVLSTGRAIALVAGAGVIPGAEIAARAPWAWERRAGFVAAMSAVASSALVVAGLAAGRIWIALAAILLAHLASGAIGPMLLSWYNELIDRENRATLLSFQTTLMTLGGAVGQPVQGWMVDAFGVARPGRSLERSR